MPDGGILLIEYVARDVIDGHQKLSEVRTYDEDPIERIVRQTWDTVPDAQTRQLLRQAIQQIPNARILRKRAVADLQFPQRCRERRSDQETIANSAGQRKLLDLRGPAELDLATVEDG